MSAQDGGLYRPPAASRDISTARSGPEVIQRGHVKEVAGQERQLLDLTDATRVLECFQVERQVGCQRIVRHYISQILYGCKSPYCVTPTCLSCQKRDAPRPVRPPTQLTARALAHYLAGQNDPQRRLCPHELNVPPHTLEIDGSGTRLHHALDDSRNGEGARGQAEATTQEQPSHAHDSVVDAVMKQHQTRKDKKSLSQNLFDSFTMIYAYSKQLPNSSSLYQSLRSSSLLSQNVTSFDSVSDAQTQTNAHDSPQDGTSTALTSGTAVAHAVNEAVPTHRQHSQPNGRAHMTPSSTTIFSNGQQIHRIPYLVHDSSSSSKVGKVTDQISLDGISEAPGLPVQKTRQKPSPVGEDVTTMGRIASPAVIPKSEGRRYQYPVRTEPAIPVVPTLSCTTLEGLKDDVYGHRRDQLSDDFNFSVDYDTKRRYQSSTPLVNRSLFYTLSDPETLLESFHDPSPHFKTSPLPHLDSARLTHSFRDWNRYNGALVFDSLCVALKALFTPPPELHVHKSPRLSPSHRATSTNSTTDGSHDSPSTSSTKQRYVSNLEAAHIVMICIHALTSSVSLGWPHTWAQVRKLRAWAIVLPNAAPETDGFMDPYLNIIDELEYEPAIRLAEHLSRAIGARTCFERILTTINKQPEEREDDSCPDCLLDIIVRHLALVESVALATKRRLTPNSTTSTSDDPGWTVTVTFVEWLKTIITKKWDNRVEINKWSSVGSAVMVLDKLSMSYSELNLRRHLFEIPFLNERLDAAEECVNFLSWQEQPNTLHILQYPALFREEDLVKYFRTINFDSMMTQYNHTTRMHQMRGLYDKFLQEPHLWLIKSRMKVTLKSYLILNVSREHPLSDTLDQLWGLEKRMLLKPLKVQMGADEGEVGADHGGVSYEFFRVVLSEAFKPDHGMFTLDEITRMTWFQAGTLEPDWKFEMIGMIFSLAIYNGVTLPVTLPQVLYHFLLQDEPPTRSKNIRNLRDCLNLVADGWPDLIKGFKQMLSYEGDVENDICREYSFSYTAFGQPISHNMSQPYVRPHQATDDSPAVRPEELLASETEESKMVTNANRGQFIMDYLHHLTYLSVLPQLQAFKQGFLACLQPKSLQFFTPDTLRKLVEGEQHIDIAGLRRCTRYEDGYTDSHPTILKFWRIVEQYNQEDRRHLLEFVTASDRVPVTGYEGITFHIKRISDGDNLPSSSTCFGKLNLPDYAGEEKMKRKLLLAIQNSKGFGFA